MSSTYDYTNDAPDQPGDSDGNTFADPATAQKMRDALTRLMIKTIDQERPPYQYGTVTVINTDGISCQVLLNGDTSAVKVAYGAMRPIAVGQVVRVSGNRGDRFISDVMGGAASTDPASSTYGLNAPTGLTLGGTYRGIIARWNVVDGAYQYEVQFADNVGMSVNVRTYTTISTQFTEEPLNAGQVVYSRVRSKASVAAGGGVSAWSSVVGPTNAVAMPVESVTDGAAPASSPTAVVTGALGFLMIEWLAVSNNDPMTYEVHLSTTNGFTPSGSTKIGETSGTFFTAKRNNAGAALAYGTTYYIKIIAKDKDGSAAAGGQGSGALLQVGTLDVSRIDTTVLGDGIAPTSSPTPTVTNGIGFLYVTWVLLGDTDYTVYEVHVSTVSGFTPSTATYVGGTPSDFFFIRKQGSGAGSAQLVYGTTYYVKLVAKDIDGAAAASAQASGTPLQVLAPDVNVTLGGGNGVSNSSFEDFTDPTLPSSWVKINSGVTLSASATATRLYNGAKSCQMDLPSGYSVGQAIGVYQIIPTSYCPRPGAPLTVSGYLYATAYGNWTPQMIVEFRNAADGIISTSTFNCSTGLNVLVRQVFTVSSVPANTDHIRLYLQFTAAGTTTAGTAYWDAIQLEQADVVSAYAPRVDEIIANTITGAMIQAGTVTSDKTNLSIGGGNLMRNSSFEVDSNSDGYPDGGWGVYSGGVTASLDSDAFRGLKSFKIVAAAGSGANGSTTNIQRPDGVQLDATPLRGLKITASVWYKITALGASQTVNIQLFARNAANAVVATGVLASVSATGTTWVRGVATITVPSDATYFQMYFTSSNANGWTGFFDGAQVELGEIATAYAPAPEEILPGSIGTTEIADNAITTQKVIAGAIVASKIAANTITASQIAANTITGDRIAAGTITAERLTIGVFGPSLIINGGFEDVSQADANTPAKWTKDTETNGSITLATTASMVKGGTRSARMQCTTTAANLFLISDYFQVEAAKIYAHEMWYRAEVDTITAGIYYEVYYYDRAQTFLSSVNPLSNAGGVAGTWNLFQGTATAPANACFARIRLGMNNPNVGTVTVDFDEVKVNEQVSATRISDGSIITAKIAAGAVTANEIAANTITAAKIAANTITAAQIAANTITAGQIAADTITATEIAANAITTSELAANSITAAKAQIADLAVATAKIQDAAITTVKIAAANITTALIANLAVTTALIADAAISNAKIGSLAVTDAKVNDLTATKLTAGTITSQVIVIGSGGQFKVGSTPGAGTTGMIVNDQGFSLYNASARTVYMDATTGNLTATTGTITGATIRTSASNPRVELDTSGRIRLYDSGGVVQFEVATGSTLVTIPGNTSAATGYGLILGGSGRYLGLHAGGSGTSGFLFDLLSSSPKMYFGDPVFTDYLGWDSTSRRVKVSNNGNGLQLLGTAAISGMLLGEHGTIGGAVGTRDAAPHATSFAWWEPGGTGTGFRLSIMIDDAEQTRFIPNLGKTFVIDHPTDRNKYLVHACAEGPTVDVFYRDRAVTDENGQAIVKLPEYFEALTHTKGRTVQLTPIGDPEVLATSDVINGEFVVVGPPNQHFFWRVDAVRITDRPMKVEPLKSETTVRGDGPYRYLAA